MKYRILKVTDDKGTWYFPQYKRFIFWKGFREYPNSYIDFSYVFFSSLRCAEGYLRTKEATPKTTTEVIPYSG